MYNEDILELLKLPVLSIKQPWAHLIVQGRKDIENRNWRTKYRGKFLIHASKTGVYRQLGEPHINDWIKAKFGIEIPKKLDMGGIVGVAEITGCVSKSTSPWFFGDYGFTIANAKPIPFIPCKGKLNFFHLTKEELDLS